MMNPLTMHHSRVIPEMYRVLGRPEEGPARLQKWYRLRDSLGGPNDAPHQRVRLLKEYNRDRMNTEVFDNDPKALELYGEMEARERKPSAGLNAALVFLKARGKRLSIVSEVTSIEGAQSIAAFIRVNGFAGLFEEMITPAGTFTPGGKLLDEVTFKGATKKEGMMYARLAAYLDSYRIGPQDRAMIGDDPKLDIDFAKKYGFITIQYRGIVDRGKAEHADYVVADWKELLEER